MLIKRNLARYFVLTLIITLAAYTNHADAQFMVEDGLVSYWSFDRATIKGDNVSDVSGNNDCTLVGGPTPGPGKVAAALSFDGLQDGVVCGKKGGLSDIFHRGGTVMAWVFSEGMGQNAQGRIMDKNQWTLMHRNEGGRALYIHADFTSNNGAWHTGPHVFDFEKWYHAAMVYDSSSDKNDPLIYIDGENEDITRKNAPAGNYTGDGDSDFAMAIRFHDKQRFHDGLIDEVAIYNRVLSDAEVQQNFRASGLSVAPADKLAITWGAMKASR